MKLTSVIFRCVLLFLLICGMGNTASKQTTPTTNMFNYRNASDSFFYNLYNSIQSNPYFNYDRKIFAASMMVRQVGDTFSYNYQFASGTTDNNLNDPLNTVLNRNTNSNNVAEAFAANSFFSQLFLSMVIFDLEYKGLLPFGVVDPIPLDYLPENYRTHMTGLNSNNILFKNMNFPTSSNNINIMSLLQHTSTLTDYYFESQTISKSFEDGADTTQTVPTLDVYVENLFSNQINGTTPANVSGIDVNLFSSPADFANATSAANYCNGVGQVGCYYFAKNNIAVLSYILNQILIATADRNNITATDVNSYSFELLFPLSLSRTFLLTTSGERSFPTYPPVTIKSNIHYFSSIVQNINADGTAINHYVVIHPSYFSDYMLYMSNADISALLGAFFFRGGMFYNSIGLRFFPSLGVNTNSENLISITDQVYNNNNISAHDPNRINLTDNNVVNLGNGGIMFFDLQKLCEEFNRGFPPSTNFYQLCEFANNKESGSRIAFGLLSKGLYNENAFLCVNLTNQVVNADSGNNLVCTSAAVHYFEGAAAATTGESTCPMNRALVLAVGGLTLFSDNTKYVPYTPPTKPPKKQDPLFALYVVLIILAAIVFVTFCAYLADYFIQPAPPLKALVPVRAVGAENMNLNHNNNANKSNYVDFAGRLLEGAMNNGAGGEDGTASPFSISTTPQGSTLRRRRGNNNSSALSTPDANNNNIPRNLKDLYEDDEEETVSTNNTNEEDKSSSNSQKVVRFDAYI